MVKIRSFFLYFKHITFNIKKIINGISIKKMLEIEKTDKKGLTIISLVNSSDEARFKIKIGQNHKINTSKENILFDKVNNLFFIFLNRPINIIVLKESKLKISNFILRCSS